MTESSVAGPCSTDDPTAAPSAGGVGERLRKVRNQQRLSLADVEERSGGKWKAVVVGAYERGDRAVTIPRLAKLAEFYGVPMSSLLPDPVAPQREAAGEGPRNDSGLRLDLRALQRPGDLDPLALQAVARFAQHISERRGDHNGRVLTVRRSDLRTIAVAIGRETATFIDALRDQGVVVSD